MPKHGFRRLDDRRSSGRRTEDGHTVKRQVDRMRDSEKTRAFQENLFTKIRSDRGGQRRSYDVGRLSRAGGFVVAVDGEVLVRSEQADLAQASATAAEFTQRASVPELDNRVTRFSKDGASVDEANRLVDTLLDRNISATVNYVVPLGYIAKGEGGFEPTDVLDDPGPGSTPGTGVRVAVIDTGATDQHRDDGWLQNLHLAPSDVDPLFMPGTHDPALLDFSAGHGTFVTGVIQQVAPTADIRTYRAVHSDGIGNEVEIAAAILRAARDGAMVINLSLGTETEKDARPVGLDVALRILATTHPDVLIVAAAGNSGHRRKMWPGAFPEVLAVAGLTADLRRADWTTYGPWVDCSAVGEGVVGPYVAGQESEDVDKEHADLFPPNAWAVGTGTSFAAPQVAGAIVALMEADPTLTPRQARDALLGSSQVTEPGCGVVLEILPGTVPVGP
jgi:subtilisin family serine protease